MMNARILELIQHPENLIKEDLEILQREISKYPYMQSIRTLHLSALNEFDAENYNKELTKTAAFTTDKKILYHFINKTLLTEDKKEENFKLKKIVFAKTEVAEIQEIKHEKVEKTVEQKPVFNEIVRSEIPETSLQKSIIGDTELETPILEKIENEFDVLKEEAPNNLPETSVGDTELEKTILEKKENEFDILKEMDSFEKQNDCFEIEPPKEKVFFKTREQDLNFTKDKILDFTENTEVKKEIKSADISFSGIDSFLPDVKFTIPSAKKSEPKLEILEKSEEKIQPKEEIIVENILNLEEAILVENKIEAPVILEEKAEEKVSVEVLPISELEPEIIFEWKPMNFLPNPLDATIKKQDSTKTEAPKEKTPPKTVENNKEIIEVKTEELLNSKKEIKEEKSSVLEERPILNVSFFSDDLGKLEDKKPIEEIPAQIIDNQETNAVSDVKSNVPNFVNTWQSWLKIDRDSPEIIKGISLPIPEKIIEKKADIIEKFIEENPKISQLKEERSFAIKEKADDISHLMTETLAKLYVEQKLYTKAIKAYEILQKKHPEKSEDFLIKIQEIKEKQGK